MTSSDISKGEGCTIEQLSGDGRGWDRVPGDATGWTLKGARKALRSLVATLHADDVADLYRITKGGREVERHHGLSLAG